MSLQSDVNDAADGLVTAIQAYMAAGGRADTVAAWCISRLRRSDERVAQAINNSGTRFTSVQPVDPRGFDLVG